MSNAPTSFADFSLPSNIVTKVDLARLVREFESLDNALTTIAVRQKAGGDAGDTPAQSPQLTQFLEANPVDLSNSGDRSAYVIQLRVLKDKAPVMNMTFAVVADPESLQQLTSWLRQSVHPQTLIDVHLQPGLVAGMYLRTQNHVFDMSVRNALKSQRGALEKALGAPRG